MRSRQRFFFYGCRSREREGERRGNHDGPVSSAGELLRAAVAVAGASQLVLLPRAGPATRHQLRAVVVPSVPSVRVEISSVAFEDPRRQHTDSIKPAHTTLYTVIQTEQKNTFRKLEEISPFCVSTKFPASLTLCKQSWRRVTITT